MSPQLTEVLKEQRKLFGRINPTGIALPTPFKEGANPEALAKIIEENFSQFKQGVRIT